MRKHSPLVCLAAVVFGYFLLWTIVPRATFYSGLIATVGNAAARSRGLPGFALSAAGLLLVFLPTVFFMIVQLAMVYYFARVRMRFLTAAAVLAGCLAATAGLAALIVAQSGVVGHLHRWPNLRETAFIMAYYNGLLKMPVVLTVMFAAAAIGYMVSLRVTDKNLLLPVVVIAACIDVFTVTRGPVSAVLTKAPEIAQAVSAPIPKVGAGAFVPSLLIGPGDFLFAALVFAVVSRLKMNELRTFWFVTAAMTAGMLAIAVGLLGFLPALILLAAGVILANWREFRLSRHEIISMLVVGAALAVALPLAWSALAPKNTPKPSPPAKKEAAPRNSR